MQQDQDFQQKMARQKLTQETTLSQHQLEIKSRQEENLANQVCLFCDLKKKK